jgi:glycogen debranching enzyme
MGAALAKAGLPSSLREFLTWYAPFQREDGFIPCVVDRDGVDWLVEHDSHGQFLWGVREVMRDGGDKKFLRAMWPHVRKAADFIITLRGERMTDAYRSAEHAACFGLLPESASHEGYLAHPVHSYWDDFWGIRGLEAAADLAALTGMADESAKWKHEAARFQNDVLRSMQNVITAKNLAYLPGSVEWADFDPTATSNAIAMLDFAGTLPAEPLRAMLATYIRDFRRKHGGEMPWTNYTAYEIRIIGAFVRLGERGIANELLDFFLTDRRPLEWNQWPEITWRDPRSPGHLGDVPHTWIAAEYLLAVASMVVSEREATGSMVLARGMPWSWISEGDGFSVKGLPTRHGKLDFRIKAHGNESIEIAIGGKLRPPPGGLTLDPPLPPGRAVADGDLTVSGLPCRKTIRFSP